MTELPAYIQSYLDKPFQRGVWALAVGFGCEVMTFLVPWPALFLFAAVAFVVAAVFGMIWLFRVRQVPTLLEKHRAIQERDARALLQRREEQAQAAEEAIRQRGLRDEARRLSFAAAEELAPGERLTLETTIGSIWATRCINGNLRLFWPFNSQVMKAAVPVVRARGRYVGDKPVAWFVDRFHEKAVLADLSRI